MNRVELIGYWDWPENRMVPDGYDMKRVPELSWRNIQFLADKFNELAEAHNEQVKEKEATV